MGHAARSTRIRQEPLALFVEDVLLLVKQRLDRKAVKRERRVTFHPLPDGVERYGEQFRVEPGAGLMLAREQNLHLLSSRVDLVVALILVVAQRRVIPDAIAEHTHAVHRAESVKQCLRTTGQRPLPGLE